MAQHVSGVGHGQPDVSRRGLLTAVGAVALAATVTPNAGANDRGMAERTFVGESKNGKFQEALDKALGQLDNALSEGSVADAQATWKLTESSGQRGGIAGLRTVKVTITATRNPPWGKK